MRKDFHMIQKWSEWFKLTEETALSQISTLYKHGKQKSISEHMNMSNLGVEALQRQKTSPSFNSCPPRAGIWGYPGHDHSKQADNIWRPSCFFNHVLKNVQFPMLFWFFFLGVPSSGQLMDVHRNTVCAETYLAHN